MLGDDGLRVLRTLALSCYARVSMSLVGMKKTCYLKHQEWCFVKLNTVLLLIKNLLVTNLLYFNYSTFSNLLDKIE